MSSLKNVLFYVEPWIEMSADFRIGACLHYNHLANILKECNPEIDIKFLISDNLFDIIVAEYGLEWCGHEIFLLPIKKLESIYPDYKIASLSNYTEKSDSINNKKIIEIVRETGISTDWNPDVILMHDTHAPFLSHLFPRALILHSNYGLTFDMPYPQMMSFDNHGLYGKAILAQKDILEKVDVSEDDKATIHLIKNWYAQQVIPHDPVWGIIEKYQSIYDKIIFLPLQFDDYYAFQVCSEYQSNKEIIENTLQNIPENWGLIVCGKPSFGDGLNSGYIMEMMLNYPNLIYLEELNNIPYVSQFLVPHADAVIAVSSSVATQALLFGVPLVSAGVSHINSFSVCDLLNIQNVFNIDIDEEVYLKVLKFLFLNYNLLSTKSIENGLSFYQYLDEYYKNHKKNINGDIFYAPSIYDNLEEFYTDLVETSRWIEWDKFLSDCKIDKKPNPVFLNIVFHEFISWDLFDTLVDRPFIHPHELFQFIEDMIKFKTGNIYFNFHMLRQESERIARAVNPNREIDFDEIYYHFQKKTGFDSKFIEQLKKWEIEAELSCVRPRYMMKKTWQFAKNLGKVRTIITDIYLFKNDIVKLLDVCGYRDYDYLFVSSDEKLRKEDGSIYPLYIKTINKNHGAGAMLHIGDNPRADGEMAKRFGIRDYIIPKAMDSLHGSDYPRLLGSPLHHNCYDTSAIIGMIANKLFSSPRPYFDASTIANGFLYNIGYSVLGPLMLGYVQWVIRRAKSLDVQVLYFLARDGFLIMKVYDLFKEKYPDLPNYKYLLCSRRSVSVAAMFDLNDILETAMLNYGTTTISSFLDNRFGLDIKELPENIFEKYLIKPNGDNKIHYPDDLGLTNNLVRDLEGLILAKAAEERSLYASYLKDEGVLEDKPMALVDIGYSGTMQRKLNRITNKKMMGFYMLTHNYVLPNFKNDIFEGWLSDYDNLRSSLKHDFNEYIPLLESMLSSEEGSFMNFFVNKYGDIQARYLYSLDEKYRIFFIKSIQRGAIQFAKDYLERFSADIMSGIELSPAASSHLFFKFGDNPSKFDVALFEGLLLENLFSGSDFSIIEKPTKYLDSDGALSMSNYHYLMNLSKWKQGASIAYQKYMANNSNQKNTGIEENNDCKSNEMTDNVIKNNGALLTKEQKLLRKLNKNPRAFVQDIRLLPWFAKKTILNNEILLDSVALVSKTYLRRKIE